MTDETIDDVMMDDLVDAPPPPPRGPVELNYANSSITIVGNTYTNRADYLADYPDRLEDCLAIGWGVKYYQDPNTGKVIAVNAETNQDQYAHLVDVTDNWPPKPIEQDVTEISIAQACKMLARWGVDDAQIEHIISQMPEGQAKVDALIEWRRATKVLIDNALVGYIAQLLGKSAELQTAFNQAAKL